MFPRWVLLVPDENLKRDESRLLTEPTEEGNTQSLFKKMNYNIGRAIKRFNAAKRKAFEQFKIFKYWRPQHFK